MFSSAQIIEILPVIVSLVVIEGLLSVDNALAIAALASHLPPKRQQLALKLGILGAYLFRGIALFFVAYVIANPWLKIVGSAYLIYLMASNLAQYGADGEEDEASVAHHPPGLLATIIQIELMDLALSLDNVVAAVALDKRIWVVCAGVFIGILALRFLAGYCIKLIEKFPILEKTAFLLIGFVGVILVVEVSFEMAHKPVHIDSLEKFVGILVIVALSLLYDQSAAVRTAFKPLIAIANPVLVVLDKVIGTIFWPAAKLIELIKGIFTRKPARQPEPETASIEQ